MNLPAVSLCMIVRDEEMRIGACLESVRPFVDEMIVVDTGSRDRTAEIAKQMGAAVFSFPWTGHFAEARNFALKRATGQWVLVLDADEQLAPCDPSSFTTLLADESAAGYYVTIRQLRSTRETDYETDVVCRMFRNLPGIAYRGRIHEDIGASLARRHPRLELKHSGLVLIHYGYLPEAVQGKDKGARNLQLLNQAVEEEADKLYYRYALGAEYFMQGQYKEAAAILFPLLVPVPPATGYAADLAYKLAYAQLQCGSLPSALQAVETGLARAPDNRELQELRAMLLLGAGRPEEARFSLLRLTGGSRPTGDQCLDGESLARLQLALGAANRQLGNWREALECYEYAAGQEFTRPQALGQWLELASLLEPTAWIINRLVNHPFSLTEPEAWVSLCPYVLKGAYSSPSEALELLPDVWPDTGRPDVRLLFYRAVLLAQHGEAGEAARLLDQLILTDPRQHLLLYRWALDNRESSSVAVNRLYDYSRTFPHLASIADALLGHSPAEPPSLADWAQAAYAMLMTGAWPGFLLIWRHYLLQANTGVKPAQQIPKEWRYALLRSPEALRQSVYNHQRELPDTGKTLGEALFTAGLATSLNRLDDARQLCQALIQEYPQRLEPRIGLIQAGLPNPDDRTNPFIVLTE